MNSYLRCIIIIAGFVLSNNVFAQCTVVINEILASPTGSTASNSMYDNYFQATTTGPTQNAEWVELYNPDPCNAVDISCWILGSDIGLVVYNTTTGATMRNRGNFTFPPGTVIPPLGFVSVGGQASGATFALNSYWGTNNFCITDNRWFLRDGYGYVLLASPTGTIVDAVYWAPTAGDLNVATGQFGNVDTTACACNLPQGPGTQTLYLPAALNIPGIEYAGDNFTTNGSPNPGAVPPTDSYGYSMKRQQDGSPTWVINGTKTINGCNGACYSLTPNNFTGTIPCTQTTGTVTGSYSIIGYTHAPYTYSWSTGATGASVSGLGAGAYTYTVTDACGCTKTANAQLTQAPGFTTTAQGTNPTCTVPGTATTTNTGGAATFSYSWSTNPVQTAQTATGLPAGTYSVQVTDAGGCTATSSTTITQPGGINATTSTTPATCNPDGSASVNATGGKVFLRIAGIMDKQVSRRQG